MYLHRFKWISRVVLIGALSTSVVSLIAQTPADNTKVNRFEGRVKNGGVLLSVHCDTSEEITRAKDVLKRTGAEDIAAAGEEAVGAASTPHSAS